MEKLIEEKRVISSFMLCTALKTGGWNGRFIQYFRDST